MATDDGHGSWRTSGHELAGRRVRRTFDGQDVDGTVTHWLPASPDRPALCHTGLERATGGGTMRANNL